MVQHWYHFHMLKTWVGLTTSGYTVLIFYDYMLTFPMEVHYVWRGDKLKVSTGLYILYRYSLPANVLYLLAVAKKLGNKVLTAL